MRISYTQRLLQRAEFTYEAITSEPPLPLDLANAKMVTIVIVMFAAMWAGANKPRSLYEFLRQRGCKLSADDVQFLLNAFEGLDRSHHLWTSIGNGAYRPLLDAIPPLQQDGDNPWSIETWEPDDVTMPS